MTSKEIAELRLLSQIDFICLQSEDRERAKAIVEQNMLIREIAFQLAVGNERAESNLPCSDINGYLVCVGKRGHEGLHVDRNGQTWSVGVHGENTKPGQSETERYLCGHTYGYRNCVATKGHSGAHIDRDGTTWGCLV